jgi:hypothetical protein
MLVIVTKVFTDSAKVLSKTENSKYVGLKDWVILEDSQVML